MSMASSSVAARCRYDIFLSFRSEDARRGFVRHLDSALCVAGFRTFLDDAELWNVENISLQMERAVEESKLSIVVISRKYASSLWFLDILLKILECKEKLGQQVIPIFLDVDPSEALGILFQVFAKHDKRNEADSRLALHMIGNIKGWDLHNVEDHWHESKFIQKIVEDVSCKLSQICMSSVLCLIGPEPPVTQFVSLLNMGSICNLTQLKPVCLINNNLNQLQLSVTNKLKYYSESIGSCFTLADLQANGLENILTPHEAKEAAMKNKKYIRRLELRWRCHNIGSSKVEEEILNCLQPNRFLQELHIFYYHGTMFPDWINGSYLCNIIDVTLSNCMNCLVLPSLGGLPLLKSLHITKVTGVEVIDDRFRRSYGRDKCHAFPKLEKLSISGMDGLKEWYGVVNGDFPCLSFLIIRNCPKLVAIEWLSYLCSPKYLEIGDCEEISSLGEKMLPSSLEFLNITNCPRLNEKYCNSEASGWFQIAHAPSIFIDMVERQCS